jgi:ADP-ribose pyrophosphatase
MNVEIGKHGPWTVNASQVVYRDPWVSLRRDEVTRPDARTGTYCVVHVKPGVCVLAIDGQGTVHLTEEFHYGVGRVTLEAVSGGVEFDEEPEAAAKRELREELGIDAARWTSLGIVDPFTANVVSPTRLFLAQELSFGKPCMDGGEVIRHITMPFEQVLAAVLDSRITHAPSAVAILKANAMKSIVFPNVS